MIGERTDTAWTTAGSMTQRTNVTDVCLDDESTHMLNERRHGCHHANQPPLPLLHGASSEQAIEIDSFLTT